MSMPILFSKLWNENFLLDKETFLLPERNCLCAGKIEFLVQYQWNLRISYGNKAERHPALFFLKKLLSVLAAANFTGLPWLK